MIEFHNESIDLNSLPKFEEVSLNKLEANYFKIITLNIILFFSVLLVGLYFLNFIENKLFTSNLLIVVAAGVLFLGFITFLIYKIGFQKRGFAFRTFDVIYKSGVISETTTIIPFNRVQHVALHQGLFSRSFGLATIQLFTAGEHSADLKIPGILLEDALKMKNFISQKINENENSVESEKSNTLDE